jgi:hypothetical protein
MMFQVYVVLFINKSTKDRVLLDPDSIRTSLSSLFFYPSPTKGIPLSIHAD